MHSKAVSMPDKSYIAHMNPALNGSTTLQHFERGNMVEMYDGIVRFLPGTATYVLITMHQRGVKIVDST